MEKVMKTQEKRIYRGWARSPKMQMPWETEYEWDDEEENGGGAGGSKKLREEPEMGWK